MSSVAKGNATKIKRGVAAQRKPRPVVKRKRKARVQRSPGWFEKLLVRLRITPELIRRTTTVALIGGACVALLMVANWMGVPRAIKSATSHQLAKAGLVVRHIEINGIAHMDRDTINLIALDQYAASMADVDLAGMRKKLMAYGWIADAQVTRRWPDTLVISVQERKPAAVWQHNGQLALVDGHGTVLQPVTAQTMPADLPVVIGPDANVQSAALDALLAHAPRLKPLVAGATWVGNRRWDLRFTTGEVLALPEGEAPAAQALTAFADKDASNALLGKGYSHFDARDSEHLIVRLSAQDHSEQAPAQGTTNGSKHG